MIGSLGDTVFEVTPDRILTPANGTARETAARYARHEVHLSKPVQEYLGPDLSQVSLSIVLDEERGVDPQAEIERIRESCEAGEVLPLVMGSDLVGDYVIVRASETWTRVHANGRVAAATVGLSLEEYQ